MSNTKDLSKSFKETAMLETTVLQLRQENKALKDTVTKLLAELNSVRNIDNSSIVQKNLTAEEEICVIQIENLRALARERRLSLEEIKTLDLLVKNKRLLNKKSTSNNEFNVLPAEISEDELLRIAESVEEKESNS